MIKHQEVFYNSVWKLLKLGHHSLPHETHIIIINSGNLLLLLSVVNYHQNGGGCKAKDRFPQIVESETFHQYWTFHQVCSCGDPGDSAAVSNTLEEVCD